MLVLDPSDLWRPGARLLALGAHADDIEIGAGGTILSLLSTHPGQVDVTWVVLSATEERAAEARASAQAFCADARSLDVEVLDVPDGRFPAWWDSVKSHLQALAAQVAPDLVLSPHPQDAHQDHRVLAEQVPTAFRDHLIWGYEIPKYDGDTCQPSVYVPLTADTLERKIALLEHHFPSQREKGWWDAELFGALPRLRGVQCRSDHAEAFACDKLVVRMAPA